MLGAGFDPATSPATHVCPTAVAAHEEEDDELEGEEGGSGGVAGIPKRDLRSAGPLVQPPPAASGAPSAGPGSRIGSEQPDASAAAAAAAAKQLGPAGGLPNPKDVRREHTCAPLLLLRLAQRRRGVPPARLPAVCIGYACCLPSPWQLG